MKFLLRIGVASFLLLICGCHQKPYSKIISIDSLSKAEKAFKKADDKTLIVFDVDETLLMPEDAIWQQGRLWDVDVAKHFSLSEPEKSVFNNLTCDRASIISQRMLHTRFKTVESNTSAIIKSLQNRHLKVIALTNWGPDEYGQIKSLKEFRRLQLCENRIDFESSFPGLAITFSEIPALVFPTNEPSYIKHPEFYKGILFGAGNPKGTILCAFLDHINFLPDNIIFFDDKEKFLFSAQDELAKRHIPFHGFLYTGAEKQAHAIDLSIIQCQLAHWKANGECMSDAQACQYLKKTSIAN